MASERLDRTFRLEPLDSSGIFLGLGVVPVSYTHLDVYKRQDHDSHQALAHHDR